MNVFSLLDFLEAEIQEAGGMPLSRKAAVDRQKCLEIIHEIRQSVPEDIKKASIIMQERERILQDAESEARMMLEEVEEQIKALVSEHEITQRAYQQSQEIMTNAQKNAREIRLATNEYADDVLIQLEEQLHKQLETIKENRSELHQSK